MHTLGYRFKPWTEEKTITDGPSILRYIRDTAQEHGIDRHIRFHHRVLAAEWSSERSRWVVEAERSDTGETVHISCAFLWVCSGYYRYDEGYAPEFPGQEDFAGRIVHPQHWPEDLDYAGKRVVVIGSGATAVTLVPAMAETAAKVTMLQRSPTYIASLPALDPLAKALRRVLPESRHLRDRALEEHPVADIHLPTEPSAAGRSKGDDPARGRARPACGIRRRHPLQPPLQPVGPAHVPGARRGPLRGDLCGQGRGRHRPDLIFHRGRDTARVRRRAGGRHRWSPPPASTCSSSAACG